MEGLLLVDGLIVTKKCILLRVHMFEILEVSCDNFFFSLRIGGSEEALRCVTTRNFKFEDFGNHKTEEHNGARVVFFLRGGNFYVV